MCERSSRRISPGRLRHGIKTDPSLTRSRARPRMTSARKDSHRSRTSFDARENFSRARSISDRCAIGPTSQARTHSLARMLEAASIEPVRSPSSIPCGRLRRSEASQLSATHRAIVPGRSIDWYDSARFQFSTPFWHEIYDFVRPLTRNFAFRWSFDRKFRVSLAL